MHVRRLGEGSSNITYDYKNSSIENNFLIKFQNFCRSTFWSSCMFRNVTFLTHFLHQRLSYVNLRLNLEENWLKIGRNFTFFLTFSASPLKGAQLKGQHTFFFSLCWIALSYRRLHFAGYSLAPDLKVTFSKVTRKDLRILF